MPIIVVDVQKMKSKVSSEIDSLESTPLVLGRSPIQSPKDFCLITYLIFYIHGIGHLLPWNFFITAHSYFEQKFTCPSTSSNSSILAFKHEGNTTNDSSSCWNHLESNFESYFSVAAMFPIVIMAGVNIWLQSKIHYKYRMVVSLVVMMSLFGVTVALVPVHSAMWVNGFFVLTLFIVVLISGFSAIFQSSTFGFAGVFPSKYISIVMSGQACAGIFASLVLIVSLAVSSNDSVTSALGYFSTALLIIILCLVSFLCMLQLKFVKFYLSGTSVVVNQTLQGQSPDEGTTPFLKIFWNIKVYALSVFTIFSVTLSLFPSVLSKIKSVDDWNETYFNSIVCFLIFNTSDFVGRYITQWITFGSHRYILFPATLLRCSFIPLFLLCKLSDQPPLAFNNDVFPILFVTLFGLSNGYFGSVAMIAAPRSVPQNQKETVSTIMVFFLSSGLFFGSLMSFLWTKVISDIHVV